MRTWYSMRPVKAPRAGLIKNLADQRALPAAGNTGYANEKAQREIYIDMAQIIGCRPLYRQFFAVSLSFPDPDGKGTIIFSLPPTDKTSL